MNKLPIPTPTATCPRCGGGFECGAQATHPCACASLSLSPELQARLRRDWTGCLCLACLASLAQEDQAATGSAESALISTTGAGVRIR